MAIPVLSEMLQLIIGWIQASPSWMKLLIYMSTLALVVGLIGSLFDTFGWTHPRVFQPQYCMVAYDVVSQVNYTGGTAWADCASQAACISTLSGGSCSCTCNPYYESSPNCDWWMRLLGFCSFQPAANITRMDCPVSSGAQCSITQTILSSTGEDITLLKACQTGNYSSNFSSADWVMQSVDVAERCKYEGLDLLDSMVLWGMTIILALIEIAWKVYPMLGVFK